MKPAVFEMHRPEALDDALQLLSGHRESAKVLAGGQSLVPLMNLRMATPSVVIDLGRIATLRGIRKTPDGLTIGAMTRQAELLADPLVATHAPLLRAAAEHIGHVQTRARGTVGGSLAHADPAAELPVAMVALDAAFTLRSTRGSRRIAARQFFAAALETVLADDEILCEITVAAVNPAARATFREYARRHGDFAIVSAAAQFDGGLGVALGGATPVPHLCTLLVKSLAAAKYDPVRIEAAVQVEVEALQPSSDIHASAEYRRHLASVLLTDCLAEVLQR